MQQVKVNKNAVVISLSCLISLLDCVSTKRSPEMLKVGKIIYITSVLTSGHKNIFPLH